MDDSIGGKDFDLTGEIVFGQPAQQLDHDLHLLRVSVAPPGAGHVRSARNPAAPARPQSRRLGIAGQLAWVVSCPFVFLYRRRFRILRFCWLLALGFCVVAGKAADAIMLLMLGHSVILLRVILSDPDKHKSR